MATGQKTGGRVKGTPNKATAKREAKIAATGLTPLDFMLDMLRDTKADYEDRKWAAQSAAPYVHPKLATTTHRGDAGSPVAFTQIKLVGE